MSSNEPFIRETEVIVGPLREDQGGGPVNQALRILSSGDRSSLRIRFSVKKTHMGIPNNSTIEIFNLSRASAERIRAAQTRVRLSAGYQNTGLDVVVNGGILSSVTEKQEADRVTRFQVRDGYGGQLRGITNKTFAPNANVADIVREMSQNMPGVSTGDIDVDGVIGPGGLSVSDRSADALDQLAAQYGFNWSIQNGVFQALQDTRAFGRVFLVSSQSRNLIKVAPILTGPMQINNGVEIQAILNPSLVPGDQVRLESDANPDLNGTYKIHEIDMEGDTFDKNWTMTIRSFRFPGL